ncbi:MAG TPA: tRNA 4-thiouridine(8) synthase ThiI [Methanocorpusculum sp.]|nr:tRNA 4-thiouridine(8) synthase ThiI [Methanocorpusculum sp.]
MEHKICGAGPALIALSGGVDSSVLLALAAKEGAAKAAATIISEFTAESEVIRAEKTAAQFGVPWHPVRISLLSDLASNPENRCYLCKKRMAEELTALASQLGCTEIYDGSHIGDKPEERPGFAAFQEACIKSPLRDAGFAKADILRLADEFGIKKVPPSGCLATRITGEITAENLKRVESAEKILRDAGISGILRVRISANNAGIEVAKHELKLASARKNLLEPLGFDTISVSLYGRHSLGNRAVMVRIGELWLKSEPVKKQFMAALTRNIKAALDARSISYEIEEFRGRLLIFGPSEEIAAEVSRIFGVVDVSICETTENTPEAIGKAAAKLAAGKLKPGMRFAVRAKRQQVKGFTSQQLAAYVADVIWQQIPGFIVDLDNPEYEIFVEAREFGGLVYDSRIAGVGGLPLGTAGRAAVLLSAGIDSPVAAWLMMKRGVSVTGVFADAGKWAGPATKDLALDNARILSTWCPGRAFSVWVVPVEQFLSAVYAKAETHYTCLYCKRFMIRAAEKIALANRMDAVVTGENLGQVASQTLQNMKIITAAVKTPVLRPLLTYDKEEAVALARKIGTYHESPGDTTCHAVPKKPATRSPEERICAEEAKLNLEEILDEAVRSAELWVAKDGVLYKKEDAHAVPDQS